MRKFSFLPPRIRTAAVHEGEHRKGSRGSVAMPLYQSSTYEMGEDPEFDGIRYIRHSNTPNQQAVAEKLSALEGTETAVVTPSGTAAVSMTLMSLLRSGDHILVQDRVYGGTRKLLEELVGRYGIRVSYVPGQQPESWARALSPRTRAIYFESMTNPLMEIAPLRDVVRFAREHSLVSVIDNTYASPVNLRPADLGFELVLHSASKYLNGHSDVVAGVVAGSAERVQLVRNLMDLTGVCLDPHACYLLMRGLKTLPLRVPAQNANALALAEALKKHPAVEQVRYPGLPDDPFHDAARRWMKGYGCLLTFVPAGGLAHAERILGRLRLPRIAPSFGGVESLVCRPANTSHAGLPPDVRRTLGVPDAMIRVSVGIEDPLDLVEDFQEALAG